MSVRTLAYRGTVVSVAAVSGSVVVVAAVTRSPLMGLVLGVALVLLPFVILRPWWATAFLLVIAVGNLSGAFGEGSLGLYLFGVMMASAAIYVALRQGTVRPVWSPVFGFALVWLAARGLSMWSLLDADLALPVVVDETQQMIVLFLVTPVVASLRKFHAAATAATACLVALAALALIQTSLGDAVTFGGLTSTATRELGGLTARHAGPGLAPDANFWARNLILFIPLSLSLAMDQRLPWRRMMYGAAAAVLLAELMFTQSRGALLALPVAVIVWTFLLGRRYRRYLAVVVLLVVGLLALPGVGSRLATLGDPGQAGTGAGDGSLVLRAYALRTGLAMFADHPVAGVGPGNFERVQDDYARRLGTPVAEPVAPHNSYLQMAAEGGLPVLLAWMAMYGCAVFLGLRAFLIASRINHGPSPSSAMLLTAGVIAGLIGWAVASVFLHLAELRVLLVMIGLAAALDIDARRESARLHPLPGVDFNLRPPQVV